MQLISHLKVRTSQFSAVPNIRKQAADRTLVGEWPATEFSNKKIFKGLTVNLDVGVTIGTGRFKLFRLQEPQEVEPERQDA